MIDESQPDHSPQANHSSKPTNLARKSCFVYGVASPYAMLGAHRYPRPVPSHGHANGTTQMSQYRESAVMRRRRCRSFRALLRDRSWGSSGRLQLLRSTSGHSTEHGHAAQCSSCAAGRERRQAHRVLEYSSRGTEPQPRRSVPARMWTWAERCVRPARPNSKRRALCHRPWGPQGLQRASA